jgi:NitT/TauT family transport system substrate-binding protein
MADIITRMVSIARIGAERRSDTGVRGGLRPSARLTSARTAASLLTKSAALLAGAALLATSAAVPARAAELKLIRVAYTVTGLLFYPSFVARGAGLFKEEGLDDQWIQAGGSAAASVAAVMGGNADMTVLGLDNAITASAKGADLVAFADLLDAYALPIVLSKKAIETTGITPTMPVDERVQKLRGLTIAVTSAGGGPDEMLRATLLARKLNPDTDLQIRPLGTAEAMLAALSKGLVDGMVTTSPFSEIAEAQGVGTVVISPLRGDLPELQGVPYTAALTTGATITRDPDLIRRATRAIARAIKLTRDQPDKAKEILKQYFPTTDPAIYQKMEETFRPIAAKATTIDRARFDKLVAWKNIGAKGALKVDYDKAVTTRFAAEADAEILGK